MNEASAYRMHNHAKELKDVEVDRAVPQDQVAISCQIVHSRYLYTWLRLTLDSQPITMSKRSGLDRSVHAILCRANIHNGSPAGRLEHEKTGRIA